VLPALVFPKCVTLCLTCVKTMCVVCSESQSVMSARSAQGELYNFIGLMFPCRSFDRMTFDRMTFDRMTWVFEREDVPFGDYND